MVRLRFVMLPPEVDQLACLGRIKRKASVLPIEVRALSSRKTVPCCPMCADIERPM
jgi:hypothetical protein